MSKARTGRTGKTGRLINQVGLPDATDDRWTGWCFICSRNGPCHHLAMEQMTRSSELIAPGAAWDEPKISQTLDSFPGTDRSASVPAGDPAALVGSASAAYHKEPRTKKWHIQAHTRRPLPELEPTRPPKRIETESVAKPGDNAANRLRPDRQGSGATIRCRPGPTHESKRLHKAREEWEQDTRRLQQPDPYAYMGVFPKAGYALAQWMTLESAFQSHLINQAISVEQRVIDRVIEDHFPIKQFSDMYQMPNNARDFGHRYMPTRPTNANPGTDTSTDSIGRVQGCLDESKISRTFISLRSAVGSASVSAGEPPAPVGGAKQSYHTRKESEYASPKKTTTPPKTSGR